MSGAIHCGAAGAGPYSDAFAAARGRLGRLASTVTFYPSAGSTNDLAAALVRDPHGQHGDPEGTVVVADEQTAGRGRRGHTWFSPPASGLYVSVVLTPARAESDRQRAMALLTLAAGAAISEAIETAAGLVTELKWPNDVYVGRRKLAGILAEAVSGCGTVSAVVVGYGINVLAVPWPPDVAQRATSIEEQTGEAVQRDRLLIETLAALARRYDDLLAGRFGLVLDAWRRRAPSACGRRVSWTDAAGEHSGDTAGIDDHGALLVRVADRVVPIVSGELRWL